MKSLGYLSAFLGGAIAGACGGIPEEAQHQTEPQGSGRPR